MRALKERIEAAVAENDQLRLMLHRSKTEHDALVSPVLAVVVLYSYCTLYNVSKMDLKA